MLTNRAVIKGEIKDSVTDKHVTIKSINGPVYKVPLWRIAFVSDSASFEQDRKEWLAKVHPERYEREGNNYYNVVVGSILKNDKEIFQSVEVLSGVIYDEEYALCLGLGFSISSDASFIPIYASYRHYSPDSKMLSFTYVDVGYALGGKEITLIPAMNGFLIGGGVGLRAYLGKKNVITFRVGYRFIGGKSTEYNRDNLHMLQLGIGLGTY